MAVNEPVIVRPILSEKSTSLGETLGKYVFQVGRSVNKIQIKRAIENRYNVKVKKVAIINQKGKVKSQTIRSGGHVLRTSGKTASWKKAIVTLHAEFKIDILNSEA